MRKLLIAIFVLAVLQGCATGTFRCTQEYYDDMVKENAALLEEKATLKAYEHGAEMPWERASMLRRNDLLAAYQRSYNTRLWVLTERAGKFNAECRTQAAP